MSTASKSTDRVAKARDRLNALARPMGSLGYLEELAIRLVEIQDTLSPTLTKKRLCLFAGSHGIASTGLTTYPTGTTEDRLQRLLAGTSPANILAEQAGIELSIIDVGVDTNAVDLPRLDFFNRRVRRGTSNFLEGGAMTSEESLMALAAGREQATLAQKEGVQLLGTGEVGVGNSTSASILYAALLGIPAKIAVGHGIGSDQVTLQKTTEIVSQALKLHGDCQTPVAWLAAVGGFEIAAMAGLILEGASLRLPVVIDGFVASAAALVARRMDPGCLDFCFFAHQSCEHPHATVLPLMDATPILNLNLWLGEGTGALLAMPILEAAAKLVRNVTP